MVETMPLDELHKAVDKGTILLFDVVRNTLFIHNIAFVGEQLPRIHNGLALRKIIFNLPSNPLPVIVEEFVDETFFLKVVISSVAYSQHNRPNLGERESCGGGFPVY